jgi:hypothetical protein
MKGAEREAQKHYKKEKANRVAPYMPDSHNIRSQKQTRRLLSDFCVDESVSLFL